MTSSRPNISISALRATSFALAILGTALIVHEAHADVVPPDFDGKIVPYELTVTGLSRASGYVMLVYPNSISSAQRHEFTVVEDGKAIPIGLHTQGPRLYLMEKAAFAQWSSQHDLSQLSYDPATEALMGGPQVVECNAYIDHEYTLPKTNPAAMIAQWFELVEGNDRACVTRELDNPSGGSIASPGESCELSSGTKTVSFALLGWLAFRAWRRRARARTATLAES